MHVLVLAIDTSTPAVTAGLVELVGDRATLVASAVTVDARAHVELLVPQVRECLRGVGKSAVNVDAVVVGVGPGPFTGLRVGISAAAAFGHAMGVPVYPVSGLDALAWDAGYEGRLLVATDARRKEVYWAEYDGTRRLSDPAVSAPGDVLHQATVAIGQGAQIYAEVFGVPTRDFLYPTPLGLVRAAVLDGSPAELTPLYLRRPDAKVSTGRKKVLPA